MSRRGNCYENAVAESFFSSLNKDRIRNHVYHTRDKARALFGLYHRGINDADLPRLHVQTRFR
jgi:transposase InsO family protein